MVQQVREHKLFGGSDLQIISVISEQEVASMIECPSGPCYI